MIGKPLGPGDRNPASAAKKAETKKDTVKIREEIGFLADPKDWVNAPAVYSVIDGQEVLTIAGQPVMEAWETGYMQELADVACSRGGEVLELGYGLGLSAKAIQAHPDVTRHTIIEANKDVIQQRAEKDLQEAMTQGRARILSGLWEQVIPTLPDASFDGIMFDTYPLNKEEIHKNHLAFLQSAYRLLKPGGIFTFYSDAATEEVFLAENLAALEQVGFKREDIKLKICKVNPPKDCKYWQDDTIVVPIITKTLG